MKKLFSPKKFVAIMVLSIFVLSGLLGGAFAPILNRVLASSGTQNKVISNYNIVGLPRANVTAGTEISDAIPELRNAFDGSLIGSAGGDAGGLIRLFRMSSSTPNGVRIAQSEWADGLYTDKSYRWRFYNATTDVDASFIYEHEVKTTQQSYSINVPTSSYDGTKLNFIPNTMLTGQELTLPLPNSFVDLKRNDLFDEETKDVVELRRAVLDSFDSSAKIASDINTTDKLNEVSEDLEKFKKVIYENTVVRFMYAEEVENKVVVDPLLLAPNQSTRDFKNDHELEYKNLLVAGARTFQPTVIANYYAEYEFIHPSIKAVFDTTNVTSISVERPNLTNKQIMGIQQTPAQNRDNQIRFDIRPTVVDNFKDLKINQPFTFNMPKVRLSSTTDSESDSYNPVTLSNNEVTSYTFVEVIHAEYDSTAKKYVESGNSISRVDETTNYTFTPEWPGAYMFVYHTTTIFGAGYTNPNEVDTDEIDGIMYFKYTPSTVTYITTNELKPELKWSVPYEVATADDVAKGIKTGDLIAADDYTKLFGVEKGTILQRYGKGSYFTAAPDLENYLPTKGLSTEADITQIDGDGKLVLPAMLGQNNIGHADELKYYLTLTRYEGTANNGSITFSTESGYPEYNPEEPFVINFGDSDTYGNDGKLNGWSFSERYARYRLEIYAMDNSDEFFDDFSKTYGQSSETKTYSFNVVSGADYEMNDEEERPVFSGGFGLNGQVFYEDQTIAFSTVRADAVYTKSDQIDVKYYIVYGTDGIEEIDDSYYVTDAAKMYFDLSSDNLKAVDILEALKNSTGILNAKIVAVAQNFYALSQSIGEDFQYVSGSALDINDIINGTTTKVGVTIESFPIKLYKWNYGASATIGLDGAASNSVADLTTKWQATFNTGNISAVKQGVVKNLPDFTVGYKGSAGKIEGLNVSTLSTTIAFRVMKPITYDRVGLIGNSYTDDDIGIGSVKIENLKFRPTEMGIHTLICEVYNTGSFVSVFTATFNVIGKVDDVDPQFKSGTPTAQVGQKVTLPWATMRIGAFNFEASLAADGSKTIRATDEPDKVWNGSDTVPYDPTTHSSMLTVGRYSIAGMEIGTQEEVPSAIGGEFVPRKPGTYLFTYTFKFTPTALENLLISVDPDFTEATKTYEITVTGIVDGDINIEPIGDRYNSITTADSYTESDGTTIVNDTTIAANPRLNEITKDNILTALVSKTKPEITMAPSQLSRAMTPVYETKTGSTALQYYELNDAKTDYKYDNDGNPIKTDVVSAETSPRPVARKTSDGYEYLYEYGRIYLPNFDAVWREGLQGFTIDVPSVSNVQVTRSDSNTPMFNSYNIDNGTEDEKHYVTIDGERFYYFQPQGKAYIPSDYDNDNQRYEASKPYDSLRPDGVYVVTVTMNIAGKEVIKTYEISIGDVAKPEIEFVNGEKEKVFKEYKIGDTFILNTKDSVRVKANGGTLTELADNGTHFANWYVARNLEVDIQLPGSGSSWATEGEDENQIRVFPEATTINPVYGTDGKLVNDHSSANRTWQFKFTEAGEYTIKLSIKSESKQPAELIIPIIIEAPVEKGGFDGGLIWGIILIILSVGLLVAVAVYFIQTGRATKFANNNPLVAKKAKKPVAENPVAEPEKE